MQLDIFNIEVNNEENNSLIPESVVPESETPKKTDNNKSSYNERQSNANQGEEIFEEYMKKSGYEIQRFGFDEKKNNIKGFFLLPPLLRSLPDYMWHNSQKGVVYFFHIKGTNKLKIDDLLQYSAFEEQFCSDKVLLRIVFCFKNSEPIFKTLSEIKKMITGNQIKEWHDKKQYIELNLGY